MFPCPDGPEDVSRSRLSQTKLETMLSSWAGLQVCFFAQAGYKISSVDAMLSVCNLASQWGGIKDYTQQLGETLNLFS